MLLYGVEAKNNEGITNSPNAVTLNLGNDSKGNDSYTTWDSGEMAKFMLGLIADQKTRMLLLGQPLTTVILSPQRFMKALEDVYKRQLYDDTKTQELVSRIRSASLDPDIEKFLLCAAERHTVFNFSRIADYYAHAPAEIQCFFEESALVIIDYQQAIENGFVRMTQRMVEIMHGGEAVSYTHLDVYKRQR